MGLLYNNPLKAWEPYDRVIAVVNTIPIIESEVNLKLERLKKIKKLRKKRLDYEKSRIIDMYIENVLVDETAEKESIVISNKKVLNQINRLINNYFSHIYKDKKELKKITIIVKERLQQKISGKIKDENKRADILLNKFIKYVEKNQKIEFENFISEIKAQMKKEQVISIAIGVSPPTKEEAKKWYNKNKKKLGFEVRVKHILITPKNRSLSEERKANNKISEILRKVRSGQSFEKLAARYSHDKASAKAGGDIGWVNIASLDPVFAGYVFRMRRYGEISKVIRSSFGYHIIKYLGRRPVTFENVERMILYKLYNEKLSNQFKKWVSHRKRESSIKIYMKNYIKG